MLTSVVDCTTIVCGVFSIRWSSKSSATNAFRCHGRTDLHQRVRRQGGLRQHGRRDAAVHSRWTPGADGRLDLGRHRSTGRRRVGTRGTARQRVAAVPGVWGRRVQRRGTLERQSSLPGHQRRRNCRQQTGSSQSRWVLLLWRNNHFISPKCGSERKYRDTHRYTLHIQIYCRNILY